MTTERLRQSIEQLTKDTAAERIKRREAMDNLIAQDADLIAADGVKLYWYRQGKDDGVEQERAKIVAWLAREEEDYPSGKYSGFAAIIREEIEAGEHLQEQSK